MEKNLIYTELLDIYKGLLTDKQAEAMEYYYDSDYSLGEISELMDISRQGVRDFIKRGETTISEMEDYVPYFESEEHKRFIQDLNEQCRASLAEYDKMLANRANEQESGNGKKLRRYFNCGN